MEGEWDRNVGDQQAPLTRQLQWLEAGSRTPRTLLVTRPFHTSNHASATATRRTPLARRSRWWGEGSHLERPADLKSSSSSPALCMLVTMSQPPTNSPFT